MTRIIAGSAGGRRLEVPRGDATRPTTDRAREAIFSMLESRGAVRGARVLDLYAGSGAMGLEAASRGAAEVVLVESLRGAAEVVRRNVAVVGAPRASVVLSSVERFLAGRRPNRFDLVLIDPPYFTPEVEVTTALSRLAQGWLSETALVVLERSGRSPEPRWPAGLHRVDVRRYGETAMWLVVPEPPRAADEAEQG